MSLQKLAGWMRRTSPMLILALIAGAVVYAAPQAGGYKVIKRMQVGGDGGWDYLLMDPPTHRLFCRARIAFPGGGRNDRQGCERHRHR